MSAGTRELLRQSLPLARQWARTLCRHVDDSGETCAAFHEIWQIMRTLDLNTTPLEHDAFFIDAMAPLLSAGARRVLISGTADYAMLDVVHRAFAAAGQRPEITVVDICETPLRLCQWYADKTGTPITVRCADVLAMPNEAAFDVICTHSFLGLFNPARRRELAAAWHRLLAPKGVVLSVIRLRPDAPERVSFTAAEAQGFVRVVVERLAASDLAAGMTSADIADLAERYIRHRVVYPVRSQTEITELLASAGFEVDYLAAEALPEGSGDRPTGPTLRGRARYARFTARRL